MGTDILRQRPHTSLGYHNPTQYVDSDTKIAGDFVLAPGFKENLESFYPKASAEDKARCLELMTALDIGHELKEEAKQYQKDSRSYEPPALLNTLNTKRPKSAASYYTKTPADVMNPYTTSYNIHYPERIPSETYAERPASHQTIRHGSSGHVHQKHYGTTYQHQYRDRNDHTQLPIHPEAELRNNPHPLNTFMTWKLPKTSGSDEANPYIGEQLSDELYDKLIRGHLATTYQNDYNPGKRGPKDAWSMQEYARVTTPRKYTLNSAQRHAFQSIPQPEELQLTTTRYGPNKNKHLATRNIVPQLPRKNNYVHVKTRTTYDKHFNETAQPTATEVRQLARLHGAQSLTRQLKWAKDEDKDAISKMLHTMSNGHQRSNKPYRAFTPACTQTSKYPQECFT